MAVVTKEYELKETLESIGKKPALVITDSQAFLNVSAVAIQRQTWYDL